MQTTAQTRVRVTTAQETENPRHAAAVLRVVLAMKRDPRAEVDEVLARVIQETGVEPRAFRAFFAEHVGQLSRSLDRR